MLNFISLKLESLLEKENPLAKTQDKPIGPPREADRELLIEFTAILQRNLEDLFDDAHNHEVKTDLPSTTDGAVGDIQLVDDGTNKYLVARYADGWHKTSNLTAI